MISRFSSVLPLHPHADSITSKDLCVRVGLLSRCSWVWVSLPDGLFDFRFQSHAVECRLNLISPEWCSLMSTYVAYHFPYILFLLLLIIFLTSYSISMLSVVTYAFIKQTKRKYGFLSYKEEKWSLVGFLTLGGWGQPWQQSAQASVPGLTLSGQAA